MVCSSLLFLFITDISIQSGYVLSIVMSLWRDRTRLQELLNNIPRVVLGDLEAEDEGGDDERSLVILVEQAVEAVEETAEAVEAAEPDEILAIILGSVAALVVAGSVLYVILLRMLPVQTRRMEAAAWTAATTVMQVKLIEYFFFGSLIFSVFHYNFSMGFAFPFMLL